MCVPLKPTISGVSFPEAIMIANVLHHKKHQNLWFFYKADKKIVAFKGTNKNDVMRQAGFLDDSYSSKTTPLNMCKITKQIV